MLALMFYLYIMADILMLEGTYYQAFNMVLDALVATATYQMWKPTSRMTTWRVSSLRKR